VRFGCTSLRGTADILARYQAEMRGYRILISASYPYPLKTIRILSVQTLLTAVRILSVSMVLLWYNYSASQKNFPRHFRL